jgi:hypothetical protein
MKTNLYTDRFETTLPPEVRKRFGPHLETKTKYVAPPAPVSVGRRTPWLLLGWSAIVISLGGILLVTYEGIRQGAAAAREDAPAPVATSVPTPITPPVGTVPSGHISLTAPTLVPEPTPFPQSEPEVRRAEPVKVGLAHMPDGSSQVVRILGQVSQQENLPLTANHPGDTYLVGSVPFVWTQLNNGTGAWIDPQIE